METVVVNETAEDVWFDDFSISRTPSIVIQETHYDPWGLELTGLGYQYGGFKANKYLFNGKEPIEESGLEYYDYGARMYDPVLGRWGVVDPLADHPNQIDKSPYAAMWNNPIRYNDPDGRCVFCPGSYYYMMASMIFSQFSNNIQAPSQRLLTGQSSNINSEYSSQLSNSQVSLMSTVSIVNDGAAVASGLKEASVQGGLLGSQVVQDFGTAIEVAGIATVQPEITAIGSTISKAGSIMEGTLKASTGDLTLQDAGYEIGKGFAFGKLSKGGFKAVGSESLSKEANNVWQGLVKGLEMLSDWTYEITTSVDNEKNK
tara:strand:- start:101172 stop:102119 length:948 start_codon:yes stop_codon:yes gene_type:complete